MVFYVSHNIYTRENKWNIQGGWAIVKMVNPDAGLGMTKTFSGQHDDDILANPDKNMFVYKYTSFSINEKLYKRVSDNLFLGAGFAFDTLGLMRLESEVCGRGSQAPDLDCSVQTGGSECVGILRIYRQAHYVVAMSHNPTSHISSQPPMIGRSRSGITPPSL